jgi:hypothetical protein
LIIERLRQFQLLDQEHPSFRRLRLAATKSNRGEVADFAAGQAKRLACFRQTGRNVFVAEISSPSWLRLDEIRDRNAKHLREPIQDAGRRGWPLVSFSTLEFVQI